jgi:hypothetical protein
MSEPTKRRVRLAAPRKQLERTIQQMTKASEREMKPEKLVDLLCEMGGMQKLLLQIDTDAKTDALKIENDQLREELATLKANPPDPLAPEKEQTAKFLREMENRELEGLRRKIKDLEASSETVTRLTEENGRLASQVAELTAQNVTLEHRALDAELKSMGPGS